MLFWKTVCPIYCLFKCKGQGAGGQGVGGRHRWGGRWVGQRVDHGGWAGWPASGLVGGPVGKRAGWTEGARLSTSVKHQQSV